ncbi:MAG TPA: 2-dehydropantoate 2-reductase [Candidatus Deferrimicrobiaceae bacterium]|nr:2-dehydropantoate 2-reductase [Candidatus Deferrimicrobiaceae bacterium]
MAAVRIVVMGSGGTGGYFGAKLARAGEDVTFVARGAHLAALRAGGLRIKSAVEGDWSVRAPAVERLDGLPPADVVLFCVKSFDTEEAAALIRPVVGPETGVLSIQNGVDNEDKLERVLGTGHVLGGAARVFSTIEAPGVVAHIFGGHLVFGEMDGRETARARALLAACQRAAIPAELVADVTRALWEKYVFLTTHAGLTALTRCPAGVLRAIPEVRELYRRIATELIAIGRAAGVKLDDGVFEQGMKLLDTVAPNAFTSLHYDLTHGKRLELETLHGHAVRLAERHRVPAPTVFAVYAALLPYRDGAPVVPAR